MKAMILAAGRGARMRPLSDATPKALLPVGGRPLIEWQVRRLVAGGIREVVINHAWLGPAIESTLGDGARFGATIAWSREPAPLETAGGIVTALPLLGDAPFAVVSADIHTAFDYGRLHDVAASIAREWPRRAAHLVLVDNPPWHPRGDMALVDGRISRDGAKLTYANIGVFHPRVFDGLAAHRVLSLFPWAYALVEEGRVTGEHFRGAWANVGTPEQLAALDRSLTHRDA